MFPIQAIQFSLQHHGWDTRHSNGIQRIRITTGYIHLVQINPLPCYEPNLKAESGYEAKSQSLISLVVVEDSLSVHGWYR